MNRLVRLIHGALHGTVRLHDPVIRETIDRLPNPDLLAVAASFQSKELQAILLTSIPEDRFTRSTNAELVSLAQSVQTCWPLFLDKTSTPFPAPSVPLVEVLLERLDTDIGLPQGARLAIKNHNGAPCVEISCAQHRLSYFVDSNDQFVLVRESKPDGR